MSYDRCVHQFTLDFRRPTINRLQIVDGDTANTFEITLKDRGKAVTLDADLHKVVAVFTRADGQIYTQDAGTGVTFTTGGVVTIDVYSSSFRTGVNNVKIQLYKRTNAGDTTYPLLLTTYEQPFQARSRAVPESGSTPSALQMPMLEKYVQDAKSWARGETGTREGENVDNAKFYADIAESLFVEHVIDPSVFEWMEAHPSESAAVIAAWLDAHPDATTTVEDGAITNAKLNAEVEDRFGDIEDQLFAERSIIVESETKTATGSGSWNFVFPSPTPIEANVEYTVKLTADTAFAENCKLIWRMDGVNYGEIGTVPAGQTSLEVTATPTVAAKSIRFSKAIQNAKYTIEISKSVPYDKLDTLRADIASLQQAESKELGSSVTVDGLMYKSILPPYYFDYAENPQSYAAADTYLDGIIRSVIDGKHLLYTTDCHYPQNSHITQQIEQYVRSKLDIMRVLFGGDILDRDDTPYIAFQVMNEYFAQCISAFGANYLPAFGNHDINTANTPDADATRMDIGIAADLYTKHLIGYVNFEESKSYGAVTGDDMESIMQTIVDNKIEDDATIPAMLGMTRDEIVDALLKYNRLHYYVDDVANKVRYIVYNTGAPDNIVVQTIFGPTNTGETMLQVNWMYNTLMSTPTGYDIVLCAHEATLDPRQSYTSYINSSYMYDILAQLSCLKLKAAMNTRVPSETAAILNTDWMPSSSQALNFADAPTVGKIVVLVGHFHRDYALKGYFFQDPSGTGGRYSYQDYKGELIDSGASISETAGEILIVGTTADKNKTTKKLPLTGVDEDAIDIVTLGNGKIELKRIGHTWAYTDGDDPGTHTDPITRTFTIT